MRLTTLALLSILLLSTGVAEAAEVDQPAAESADRHAYFGFAFNYQYKQSPMALVVCGVRPNGPAEKAGLEVDDRIVAIDGRADFKNAFEVLLHVYGKKPDQTVILTIRRGNEDVPVPLVGVEANREQIETMRRNLLHAREEAERHRE